MGFGAFHGSHMLEAAVKKFNSSGLLWKKIKLTPTRKANAKMRIRRIWQNDAVLKACSAPQPDSETSATEVSKIGSTTKNKSNQ